MRMEEKTKRELVGGLGGCVIQTLAIIGVAAIVSRIFSGLPVEAKALLICVVGAVVLGIDLNRTTMSSGEVTRTPVDPDLERAQKEAELHWKHLHEHRAEYDAINREHNAKQIERAKALARKLDQSDPGAQ